MFAEASIRLGSLNIAGRFVVESSEPILVATPEVPDILDLKFNSGIILPTLPL